MEQTLKRILRTIGATILGGLLGYASITADFIPFLGVFGALAFIGLVFPFFYWIQVSDSQAISLRDAYRKVPNWLMKLLPHLLGMAMLTFVWIFELRLQRTIVGASLGLLVALCDWYTRSKETASQLVDT